MRLGLFDQSHLIFFFFLSRLLLSSSRLFRVIIKPRLLLSYAAIFSSTWHLIQATLLLPFSDTSTFFIPFTTFQLFPSQLWDCPNINPDVMLSFMDLFDTPEFTRKFNSLELLENEFLTVVGKTAELAAKNVMSKLKEMVSGR